LTRLWLLGKHAEHTSRCLFAIVHVSLFNGWLSSWPVGGE